jgi:8-oxo-dGTP diphosphatase
MGLKKRGFGAGMYNGFGGKPEEGESLKEAAIRELKEECGLETDAGCLRKVGEIAFSVPEKQEEDQTVHIYFIENWSGEPKETEEMKPAWCSRTSPPYDKMWEGDRLWLPQLLKGKSVKGRMVYSADSRLLKHDLDVTETKSEVRQ